MVLNQRYCISGCTSFCTGGSTILDLEDLFAQGVTDQSGNWSMISDPDGNNHGMLTGATFDATDSDAGIYEIQYQLWNVPDGCPDIRASETYVDGAEETITGDVTLIK